jgi:type VI protein secretion system component Hcp
MRAYAPVGSLAMLAALAGCSAADGAGGEPVEQTSETTEAVKVSPSATISGIGTFAIDSARFETTITAPTGSWEPKLFEDEASGRVIPTVELELTSPRRKVTLSDVLVNSIATSVSPQGVPTATFTLSFTSIRSH